MINRLFNLPLAIAAIVMVESVYAQNALWYAKGSFGYSFVSMRTVNSDNDADVAGWNRLGISLPPFPKFGNAVTWSGGVEYRYTPETALTFSLTFVSQGVRTSYAQPEVSLVMNRSIGSTTAFLGIKQTFHSTPSVEWYGLTDAGILFARAHADAYGTETKKSGDTTITQTIVDTQAEYAKSKLVVRLGTGTTFQLSDSFSAYAETSYTFGKIGRMNGEVTRNGVHRTEESTIDFDFSSLSISVGLSVAF